MHDAFGVFLDAAEEVGDDVGAEVVAGDKGVWACAFDFDLEGFEGDVDDLVDDGDDDRAAVDNAFAAADAGASVTP